MTLSSCRQQNLGFRFILFNFVPKSINTFKNVSLLYFREIYTCAVLTVTKFLLKVLPLNLWLA